MSTITITNSYSYLFYDFDVLIYLEEVLTVQYEIDFSNFNSFDIFPIVNKSNKILVWGAYDQWKVEVPIGTYESNDMEQKRSIIFQIDDEDDWSNRYSSN